MTYFWMHGAKTEGQIIGAKKTIGTILEMKFGLTATDLLPLLDGITDIEALEAIARGFSSPNHWTRCRIL
ncbi:hypothetical protein [Sporomusa malonica]|uniref:hypothetical protein n=1 Tax=Sporomusa malonica TaxID=112901 RepID=UPI00111C8D8F|nr:hypothetical protein [Sporomusa malonica]